MTDVFSNDQPESIKLDDIVGEGKQFSSADELVKSWVAGRAHIKTIEDENKTFKQKVATSTTLEQALAELKKGNMTPPTQTAPTSATTQSVLDEDTLKAKVEEVFAEKTAAQKAAEAKAQVQAALIQTYGTPEKVREQLNKKAVELETTVSDLEKMAINSPKVFLQLMKSEQQTTSSPSVSRSTINAEARRVERPTDGNQMSKYTALIREKGYNYYMSPEVQNEIMREAMANPAAFGIKL